MAADAWTFYDNAKEYFGDGTFDFDAGDNNFRVVLLASGYTPSAAHDTYNDLTNELATANGYTVGGQALSNSTWTEASGTAKFNADDITWTASGGAITARYAVLVHKAAGGAGAPATTDKLIAYCLLDNTPADVSAADGADLTIQLHADGFFTLA